MARYVIEKEPKNFQEASQFAEKWLNMDFNIGNLNPNDASTGQELAWNRIEGQQNEENPEIEGKNREINPEEPNDETTDDTFVIEYVAKFDELTPEAADEAVTQQLKEAYTKDDPTEVGPITVEELYNAYEFKPELKAMIEAYEDWINQPKTVADEAKYRPRNNTELMMGVRHIELIKDPEEEFSCTYDGDTLKIKSLKYLKVDWDPERKCTLVNNLPWKGNPAKGISKSSKARHWVIQKAWNGQIHGKIITGRQLKLRPLYAECEVLFPFKNEEEAKEFYPEVESFANITPSKLFKGFDEQLGETEPTTKWLVLNPSEGHECEAEASESDDDDSISLSSGWSFEEEKYDPEILPIKMERELTRINNNAARTTFQMSGIRRSFLELKQKYEEVHAEQRLVRQQMQHMKRKLDYTVQGLGALVANTKRPKMTEEVTDHPGPKKSAETAEKTEETTTTDWEAKFEETFGELKIVDWTTLMEEDDNSGGVVLSVKNLGTCKCNVQWLEVKELTGLTGFASNANCRAMFGGIVLKSKKLKTNPSHQVG
uniref:Uncharacterized protein n=1 Tax=Panagrolaimus sp. JU765 TaxID=591449 RepID=A0AC34R0I4_9BILA